MEKVALQLKKAGLEKVLLNEPMANYTTWRVGGPADIFICPKNKEELEITMEVLKEFKVPWLILGRGSNLLVRDKGIRGAVLKLEGDFTELTINGGKIVVGSSYSTVLLAITIAKLGLRGFEFAGGIPGNIGGAVYMNAGAHGSDISKVLKFAEIFTSDKGFFKMSNEDLKFKYRYSILQDIKGIVTKAFFEFEEANKEEVFKVFNAYKKRRLETQPFDLPCAGSVFKNPPNNFAGKLIEEAGLKGYEIGGAKVSTLHANFIVNKGDATAQDILNLIDYIIATVKDKFSITLEKEVRVAGE